LKDYCETQIERYRSPNNKHKQASSKEVNVSYSNLMMQTFSKFPGNDYPTYHNHGLAEEGGN
jgi:hypothetical protein